jgi:hypothetical protein
MGFKDLGTIDQKRIGIGIRFRKESRGRGCVAKKLEDGNGKGCEKKKEEHGKGEWVTWEQEKGSREAMDVIQKFSVQPFVHHVMVLSKMCYKQPMHG